MKILFNNQSDLVTALQSGEESAYNFLFESYYSELLNYTIGLTKDSDKASDIVQVTFIKIWNHRDTLNIHTSIKNYLFSSAYHHFIDAYRKEKSQFDLLEQLKNEAFLEIISDDDSIKKERIQQVQKIISSLPPKCREIFLMSKKDGLRYQEIGTTLNISVKTVEAQISKAFKKIREEVDI
ncbi:MAG: RNA polymerase sigma-70 factor [Flavobacteriaceae bacterium]|nr:MAG: RNA polymerase sigma-70 factor [Flavobacteriaceae bacterium]